MLSTSNFTILTSSYSQAQQTQERHSICCQHQTSPFLHLHTVRHSKLKKDIPYVVNIKLHHSYIFIQSGTANSRKTFHMLSTSNFTILTSSYSQAQQTQERHSICCQHQTSPFLHLHTVRYSKLKKDIPYVVNIKLHHSYIFIQSGTANSRKTFHMLSTSNFTILTSSYSQAQQTQERHSIC